jgi:hypothetical protein
MKDLIRCFVFGLAVGRATARSLSPRWETCPAGSCSFTLTVNGSPVYENPVDEHQLAFGGTEPGPTVHFCINAEGQITDNAGVCGITQNTDSDEETSQLQCEEGMSMHSSS